MLAICTGITRATYTHEQVYGRFCTVQSHVDCPPDKTFEYLSKGHNLEEWTYSVRDFAPAGKPGLWVGVDRLQEGTKIYCTVKADPDAMTVDYHCAWDQGDVLWMIYLMRVVPAKLVLGRPGSVITWTNCRHPYYDNNPFPEKAPKGRKVWVGDMWPFFYAGHKIELDNLKHILEYRHAHGLPMTIGGRS
jgi:hypothetical protein